MRLSDHRGFFVETFPAERYASIGVRHPFVKESVARPPHGMPRGLHLQYPNGRVPRDFAHGFVVLWESADPEFEIEWQDTYPEVSARDVPAPLLRGAGRLPVQAS